MEIVPIFAIVGIFSSLIIFLYLYLSSRHKVRMALIEQGRDASIFNESRDHQSSLKYGLVAIGAGLGVLVGSYLDRTGMPEAVAYFSMILLFGGGALVFFYFYINGKKKEREMV